MGVGVGVTDEVCGDFYLLLPDVDGFVVGGEGGGVAGRVGEVFGIRCRNWWASGDGGEGEEGVAMVVLRFIGTPGNDE